MVECTRCGTTNDENAKYCAKCGANLEASMEERFEKRTEEWGEQMEKRAGECFGLPRGGAIFGLFIGIIIIIVGLQQIFGWNIDVGPFVIIIVGLLILAGAIYGLTRRS